VERGKQEEVEVTGRLGETCQSLENLAESVKEWRLRLRLRLRAKE